jgi:ribosomal protein S18 acetylase RimI-like enzyme
VEIYKADISDLYSLQTLSVSTFTETFADDNSSNPFTEFYLIRSEAKPIAYLKLNSGNAQSEPMGNESLELERIYILKEFLGQGSGQILMNYTIEIARKKKVKYIWLGVWENNHRALSFYKKYGFEVYGQHIFQFGNDPQTDLLMRLFL